MKEREESFPVNDGSFETCVGEVSRARNDRLGLQAFAHAQRGHIGYESGCCDGYGVSGAKAD